MMRRLFSAGRVSYYSLVAVLAAAAFGLGLWHASAVGESIVLSGEAHHEVSDGEECTLAFRVEAGGHCSAVDSGVRCFPAEVYRDGIALPADGPLDLYQGDMIRIRVRVPSNGEAEARGTLVLRSGVTTLSSRPWSVNYFRRLYLRLHQVWNESPVRWGQDVDIEWQLENRTPQTGWTQRLKVTGAPDDLVNVVTSGHEGGVLRIMTQIRLPHEWGDLACGQLRVEVDGAVCAAHWKIPIEIASDAGCSGLILARGGLGAFGGQIRTRLPATVKAATHRVQIAEAHGCQIDAWIDAEAEHLICRVRDEGEGAWFAIVRVIVGVESYEYRVIPAR